MIDREKVIKGLEVCKSVDDTCANCPYVKEVCTTTLSADALALLKERDAVKPIKENDGKKEPWTTWWYVCGACGKVAVDTYDKFCRNCGTPIDWQEGR